MKGRDPHGKGSSGVTVFPHWAVSRNSEVSIRPGVRPLRQGDVGLLEWLGDWVGSVQEPNQAVSLEQRPEYWLLASSIQAIALKELISLVL